MPPRLPKPDPEALAITALGFLAGDAERLSRFLALTGLGPGDIRRVASEPGFLASVLDHLMADESLLLAFAAHASVAPEQIASARQSFGGVGDPGY